jgi:hypothetical protein
MRENGLQGRCGRKKVRTTIRDPKAAPAADLVERQFEQQHLDVLWIGDVTYIPTGEGFLYLSTVIDACSRRLLGWSITDHLRTELCLDALRAAAGLRGGRAAIDGVIFHSDRGCQYTAEAYRQACDQLGITQSMGSVGDSYDNAMAEAFFSSLKRELVDDEHFATKAAARAAVFRWLVWYNEAASQRPPLPAPGRVREDPHHPSTTSSLSVRPDGGCSLWLGHEDVQSTQMYVHADMTMKERALARTTPHGAPPGRYRAPDSLLAFLESL